MAKKRILIIALALIIIFSAYLYQSSKNSCPDFNQGILSLNNNKNISVAFAITTPEQTKGLSGCSVVKPGQGMYFVFSDKINAVFWMKDMIIPIDIVWISDNKVIGIEHNVPPPEDDNLLKYYAPQKIDAVLELGAGHATQLQITTDTIIQINKNKK